MKKVFMSLSLVAFLGLTMTSCLKNDSTPTPQAQDPSIEKPAIDAFNLTSGFSMQEKTDSSRIIYQPAQGQLASFMALTPGLMYQVVNPGETTQGSTDVPYSTLGSDRIGNRASFNLITDSTLYISVEYKGTLLNGTVFDSTKTGQPAIMFLPNLLPAWKALLNKIGKGGKLRITTPSAYAYGPSQVGSIPVNSPLFFEVTLVGAIKNDYAAY